MSSGIVNCNQDILHEGKSIFQKKEKKFKVIEE